MHEEIRREAKGMTPDALRAKVLECSAAAETWKRHDREYGSSVAEDHEAQAEVYRRELRGRGEPTVKRCGEETFCGHEVDFADDSGAESGLELA